MKISQSSTQLIWNLIGCFISDFKTTTGLLTKLMMPRCCDDIIDLDSSTASSKAAASETDQPPLGNNSKKGNTTQEDVEDPTTPKVRFIKRTESILKFMS